MKKRIVKNIILDLIAFLLMECIILIISFVIGSFIVLTSTTENSKDLIDATIFATIAISIVVFIVNIVHTIVCIRTENCLFKKFSLRNYTYTKISGYLNDSQKVKEELIKIISKLDNTFDSNSNSFIVNIGSQKITYNIPATSLPVELLTDIITRFGCRFFLFPKDYDCVILCVKNSEDKVIYEKYVSYSGDISYHTIINNFTPINN